MRIDGRSLSELIAESEDSQSDALRDSKAPLTDRADLREPRRGVPVDTDEIAAFSIARCGLLARVGAIGGGVA